MEKSANPINTLAKSLVDSASSMAETTKRDLAENERGQRLISNFLKGGVALGGGAGIAVALANYIKSLSDEGDRNDEERLDDDTAYIRVEKKASNDKWVAPGLAVAGGVVGGVSAYALVQSIYQRIQRNALLKELDETQQNVIARSDQEGELAKESSEWSPIADSLTAAPVAIPLLALLASGGLTYAALNKSFPILRKKRNSKPKRIRVIAADAADDMDSIYDEEGEDISKEAAVFNREHADFCAAGDEFLTSLVANMPAVNGHNVTRDILCKAASGAIGELEEAVKTGGHAALVAITKGASHKNVSNKSKALAVIGLHKSAILSPLVRGIAAAECVDRTHTVYSTMLAGCDDATLTKLAHVGCLLGLQSRDDSLTAHYGDVEPLAKSAGMLSSVVAAVDAENSAAQAEEDAGDADEGSDTLTSDSGRQLADNASLGEGGGDVEEDDAVDEVFTAAEEGTEYGEEYEDDLEEGEEAPDTAEAQ